jgi:hypothetical protein
MSIDCTQKIIDVEKVHVFIDTTLGQPALNFASGLYPINWGLDT